MFPDRVDRIIIDAVLNPHNYWHYQYAFPLYNPELGCPN